MSGFHTIVSKEKMKLPKEGLATSKGSSDVLQQEFSIILRNSEPGSADPGCFISMNWLQGTKALLWFSMGSRSSPLGGLKFHRNASGNVWSARFQSIFSPPFRMD